MGKQIHLREVLMSYGDLQGLSLLYVHLCVDVCLAEVLKSRVLFPSGKSPVLNLCHQHCDIESDGPSRIPLMDRSGQSVNDMNGHSTISLVRMTSEPQEDEWGGT